MLLLVVLPLAGCALGHGADRRNDAMMAQRLLAAGFHDVPADSPEKLARLDAMPDRLFTTALYDGKPYHLLADRRGCRCVYIGTEGAYLRYQDLEVKSEIPSSNRADARALEDAAAVDRLEFFWHPSDTGTVFPSGLQP
jgi:hypothetical protein